MASRVKEEEKNERIIRGLLKLPGNRRCINCNSLGPQYVCTNFWTFVCTTCSGIHREFTHRVKSISMAKFTSQEVLSLQGGGNERARQIYFKEWDLQRISSPDTSNIGKLRDFIKHVYVDKRYTGDGILQKSSSGRTVGSEDLHGGGSKSPGYGDAYVRRYSEGGRPGGRSGERFGEIIGERSPSYEKGSVQHNDSRSSSNSEVINDWRREDRFANGRSAEEGRSPDSQNNASSSSSPVARPVRDILGENVPLRIMKPPKAGSIEVANTVLQNQSSVGSGGLESKKEDPVEPKIKSLIDFDSDPSPVPSSAPQQQQQNVTAQSTSGGASLLSTDNWASFDFGSTPSSSGVPSSTKSIESALSDLSILTQPPVTLPGDSLGKDVATSQSWMNPPPQFAHSTVQSSFQHTSSSLVSTGLPVPSTSSSETRKALPEDLFTGFPPQNPRWQMGGPGVRGPFMTGLNPRFQQPSGTFNPFDFSGHAMQPYAFPSMASLRTAPHYLPPQASLAVPPNPNWTQPSFGLPPPLPMALSTFPQPPRPYMGEQLPGGSMYLDGQVMSNTSQSAPDSSHSASRNPFA